MGDPFTEKLLLEASLELIKSGHITGIQDMGAAGITSSASEMAGRSGNGVEIDMELVPVREPGMTPYEILLSESQERMLVVAKAGSEDAVKEILTKWELEAEEIGRVTDDGLFRVLEGDHVVAEIPSLPLTEGCPTYEREGVESEEIRELRTADLTRFAEADCDHSEAFTKLMASSEHRIEALGLQPIRHDGSHRYGHPARWRRRGGAPSRDSQGRGRDDRL